MNRLAASTLGSPGEPLLQVAYDSYAAGAALTELRSSTSPRTGEIRFNGESSADARSILDHVGSSALSVASYLRVAGAGFDWSEADRLLDSAAELRAPFLRVFPGAPVLDAASDTVPPLREPRAQVDTRAADRLGELAVLARMRAVTVALETHDSHPRASDVVRVFDLLSDSDRAHIGVIWDVLHPWRTGESFADTWQALSPYLTTGRGFIQLKDVRSRADLHPELPGTGALPLRTVIDLLSSVGYQGALSLEWERAWYPEIAPLPDALRSLVALLER